MLDNKTLIKEGNCMECTLVNSDGQIRIPKEILTQLGIEKDTKVYFYQRYGELVIKPASYDPLKELQKLCENMASDMGWETGEDIVEFCREYRKARHSKNAYNPIITLCHHHG